MSSPKPPPLSRQVVLVTGAASGIGAEVSRQLVRQGARVGLLDRDDVALDGVSRELGPAARGFVADVTDSASLARAIDDAAAHFGRIDAVIANAGIAGPPATLATIEPSDFEMVIDVNVLGAWRTVRLAMPHLTPRGGYVLAVASIAAAMPCPTLAAYGASKAAVESLCRSLRMELTGTGISVGTAYFGVVDTPLIATIRAHRNDVFADLGPLGNPVPVATAAAAIVDGVTRRRARVVAPRWVPILLGLRTVFAAADGLVARLPAVRKAIRQGGAP